MASGYFPISKSDERHKELTGITDKLSKIIEEAYTAACELECSENAASDGMYIANLSLAKEQILETLEK